MLIAVAASLFLGAQPAHAYVPPSFFVIRMLARKHTSFEDGRFRSKVTFYKKGGEIAHTVNETLVVNSSEQVTVRVSDINGGEIATHTRKLNGPRPVLYDILFIKDGASIYEHMRQLGLPLKTESALYAEKEGSMPYKPEPYVAMERLDGRVAVVVGDKAKATDAPTGTSLWIEKDSFLPLRAVFPSAPESGMSSEPLDYRFSGFTVHRSFLYPRVVQILRNGTLWARIEMQDVRSATPLEAAPSKADPDSDLRENVETYLRWVR